jgi:hypothetical protein
MLFAFLLDEETKKAICETSGSGRKASRKERTPPTSFEIVHSSQTNSIHPINKMVYDSFDRNVKLPEAGQVVCVRYL